MRSASPTRLTRRSCPRSRQVLADTALRNLIEPLAELPPKQQARAVWWLGDVRVRLHDMIRELAEQVAAPDSTEPLSVGLARLDELLADFYGRQASPLPGATDLANLAVVPPATQRPRLLEALVPSVPVTRPDEEPAGFVNVLPGETEPFRAKLTRRIHDDLDEQHKSTVVGRGEASARRRRRPVRHGSRRAYRPPG